MWGAQLLRRVEATQRLQDSHSLGNRRLVIDSSRDPGISVPGNSEFGEIDQALALIERLLMTRGASISLSRRPITQAEPHLC